MNMYFIILWVLGDVTAEQVAVFAMTVKDFLEVPEPGN